MILFGVPTPMFILNFLQFSIASCSLICLAKSFVTLAPLSSNFLRALDLIRSLPFFSSLVFWQQEKHT